MSKNKNNTKKLGLFYKSHGKWTTVPYRGFTFTAYQASRNPIKADIAVLQKEVLKSKIRLAPVK